MVDKIIGSFYSQSNIYFTECGHLYLLLYLYVYIFYYVCIFISSIIFVLQTVFIQSSNHKTGVAELPSYLCRGLITHIKKQNGIYNVLLVDHGISIELNRDEIYKVSKDFIPEEYLTKTVGLYNVWPIRMKKKVINVHSLSEYKNKSTAM